MVPASTSATQDMSLTLAGGPPKARGGSRSLTSSRGSASPVPKDGDPKGRDANKSRAEEHQDGRIDTKEFADRHRIVLTPSIRNAGCYRPKRLDTPPAASATRNAPIKIRTLGSTIRNSASGITQSPLVAEATPLRPRAILNTPHGASLRQPRDLVSREDARSQVLVRLRGKKETPAAWIRPGPVELQPRRWGKVGSQRARTMARGVADACELAHASTRSARSVSAQRLTEWPNFNLGGRSRTDHTEPQLLTRLLLV